MPEREPLIADVPPVLPRGAGREDVVIEIAASLFLRNGVDAVKMTDIADASGVGVATLYRHFATKLRIALMAGTLMWRRFHAYIRKMVDSDAYAALDGMGRLSLLMGEYRNNYAAYPGLVSFLAELDHLIVTEGADEALLVAYGEEVDSFYEAFEQAYLLGLGDGSIAREVDFPVFYKTVAHAIMGGAEKISRGDVIPSDDFSRGVDELSCIVDMALTSLRVPNA
jgi:AcrR family transcriptional regulator